MGCLRAVLGAPREVTLSAVTRVGRAADNELVLDETCVSNFHAVIAWVAPGTWELRDLGSSNGTFVNGARLEHAERRRVARHAKIAFGEAAAGWELIDDSRPLPEVWDLATGERMTGSAHLLSLHTAEGTIDILEESIGSWVLERGETIVDIRNGEILQLDGKRLKVGLPLPIAETEQTGGFKAITGDPLGGARLTFFVSADAESVEMRVEWAKQRWESSRAYNRALLALAQTRRRDEAAGSIAPDEQGWIYGDELCTLADYDSLPRLNVEIHRARSDFARQGIPGAPSVVERRRGTGQIRLGTATVSIRKGRPR